MGKPKLDIGGPSGAFNVLAHNYAEQRKAAAFPSGAFNRAAEIEWINPRHANDAELPQAHLHLSDQELSSLAGKPVWLLQVSGQESAPKRINGALSPEAARANWAETKRIMLSKVSKAFWNKIDDPRNSIREASGKTVNAYSYMLDMKQDPKFKPQPPLPEGHPLAKLHLRVMWPQRWPLSRVSDISIIRLFPARYGPTAMWTYWSSLPKRLTQRIPANADLDTILLGHELRHAMQPYPDSPRTSESYFGEVDADRYARPFAQKLGVHPGTFEAFLAGRCITSFTETPRTWSAHTTIPALIDNSIAQWPLQRVDGMRRELRARTAMMLTGQKFDLTSQEIKDAVEYKYPKDAARKAHIKALMTAARKADTKVSRKTDLYAERRLLALKKLWYNKTEMDADTTYFAGLVLESAALYWPDLAKTRTQFRQVHTKSFTR